MENNWEYCVYSYNEKYLEKVEEKDTLAVAMRLNSVGVYVQDLS